MAPAKFSTFGVLDEISTAALYIDYLEL